MGSNPAWCTILFPLLKGIASKPCNQQHFASHREPGERSHACFLSFSAQNADPVKFSMGN